uniref:Tetratricopeptide repeat protein 9C n=1 Tax=Romanomermis culicivorax TaxID=13658 RepID=A0A915K1N7_ROMCU
MPPGFPVRLDIPLLASVSAKITFQKLEFRQNLPDALFEAPNSYREEKTHSPQNGHSKQFQMASNDGYLTHLQEAEDLKSKGNELFAQKNYKDAIRFYHNALLKIPVLTKPGLSGFLEPENESSLSPIQTKCNELTKICKLNLAACLISQPDRDPAVYARAAKYCDFVLCSEPNNLKALYRKGVALFLASNYHEASDILNSVDKRFCGKDEKIRRYLNDCRENLSRNESLLKERMIKAFNNPPSLEHTTGDKDQTN